MRLSFLLFPILALAFACAVFSQDKPNAAMSGHDSMQQMMPAPGQETRGGPMFERDGMSGMKGRMMAGAQCSWGNGMQGPCCGCMQGQMMRGAFMYRHPRIFPICIMLLLLVIGLINILLTILVCMDMARLAAFNAIWIPIILLFGIPGTALYALFRIGDMIKVAGK